MVSKVTVSLPDDLLARIDAEAAARGESRSLIVQEASACYLAQTAEERAQQARRVRVGDAIRAMKSISASAVLDTRPSLEILREVRATDDAAQDREPSDSGRSPGGARSGDEPGGPSEADADAGL